MYLVIGYNNCKKAVEACIENRYFTVAYLYDEEKTMDLHIHNCLEIYYSISGGKHFLIGDKCYEIAPGDAFVINQYESHHVTLTGTEPHERIVLSIDPEFLAGLSSPHTDLTRCFHSRTPSQGNRLSLSRELQQRFIYYAHKITGTSGYGADLVERAALTELIVMLENVFEQPPQNAPAHQYQYNRMVMDLLEYINLNIRERLTVKQLAKHFFVSESYLCRAFRMEMGTTINKYITARRISMAKAMLMNGVSVTEACEMSGFNDYVNFIKSFTNKVGVSPKRFSKWSTN